MPSKKRSTAASQRQHLRAVLLPLVTSVRGQIFLVNLSGALSLLPSANVRDALLRVSRADARRMHEADYLPHLKSVIQRPEFGLLLWCKVTSFTEFAPDGWVVNVLPYPSYKAYYEDASGAISGHGAFGSSAGQREVRFRPGATTATQWWIAPRHSIVPTTITTNNAQRSRDLLGLVHYGNDVDLVALHVCTPSCDVFRPTVIEANPNARYRQVDPTAPLEKRWGRTIDLAKLATTAAASDIGGVHELVASGVALSSCTRVEFFYLGKTVDDRSTTSADLAFLNLLPRKRRGVDLVEDIMQVIAP